MNIRTRRNKIDPKIAHTKKRDCDVCGFSYYERELHEQDGLLVCDADLDEEPSYEDNRRNEGR